jgi:ABC-type lipoprotein export system ATPase subunit
LLNELGIGKKTQSYPKELSAGEQRRVAIARALINHPKILLADEPTSNMDPFTEREIMLKLASIHLEGITVILVTHNLDFLPRATRTVSMNGGQLN